MDIEAIKQWLASGKTDAIENAWMEAIEQGTALATMVKTLETVVDAGNEATAESLGWMLLSEIDESAPPADALEAFRAVLPMMKAEGELRDKAAALYEKVHGQHEHFKTFLAESGLQGNQATRRAIRTLDTCLAIEKGSYLANRYDHRAARVEGFDAVLEEFELTETAGHTTSMKPKPLADEFAPADETDFRVLCAFEREKLAKTIAGKPKDLLLSICKAHGGEITATDLKKLLVPKHMDVGKWGGWWSRARTAAKRAEHLAISGRNPTVIEYHPHGRSLVDELAEPLALAKVPQDYFAVLQEYSGEIRRRRQEVDVEFARSIMDRLAEQVNRFHGRPGNESLTAALVIAAERETNMPAPQVECPSAADLLGECEDPAEAIAEIEEHSLWPVAYEAMAARPDANEQFEKLMRLLPAKELDTIAKRLNQIGRGEVIEIAVADALAIPAENVQTCLWLWSGPAEPIANAPGPMELLGRILTAADELHRNWDIGHSHRRETFKLVRAAMVAGNCKMFRAAVAEMDDDTAAVFKRRIERSEGLTDSSRERLLAIIKEEFFLLFVEARVAPWLDESFLWTTNESLIKHEADLKELQEITLPANSNAIGVAAEKGDLRENSEWQFAVEEQRRLHGVLAQLQNDLIRARIIDPHEIATDSVGIGSKVKLRRSTDGEQIEATFLGPWESDVTKHIYNYKTPLALSLMGKALGETVPAKLDGIEAEYTIESIEAGLSILP